MQVENEEPGGEPLAVRDGLTATARRRELVRYIEQFMIVRAEVLADRFGVSAMTIHRDLDLLSGEGLIERIRGGARRISRTFTERDIRLRRMTRTAEKAALAATAAQLVQTGDIVAFDDSTTVAAMLPLIAARRPSAIITHSLGLMHDLALAHPEIPLVGLGGQYYPETDSFLGVGAVEQVNRMSADVVFASTTSVKNGGLFHPDSEAAEMKRALIGMAARKVLLFDVTKFGGKGLYLVVDLDVFDDVVVEAGLPEERRAELDQIRATVHYVGAP